MSPPEKLHAGASIDVLHEQVAKLTGAGVNDRNRLAGDVALALLDTARLIVVVLDANARVVYVNSYFEDLTGFTLDQLADQDWFATVLPPEEVKRAGRVFDEAINGIPTVRNINSIQTKSGESRVIEWFDRGLADPEGRQTGILCLGHDVTERVEAIRALEVVNHELEARVEERTAELAASEAKFRSLIESLDECVYRVRAPDGACEYMSPAAQLVFGYPDERFLEPDDFLASIVAPECRERFRAHRAAVASGQTTDPIEFKVDQPDGSKRCILQSNKPVRDQAGSIVSIEGICRDITQVRADESQLRRTIQLLEGSFDATTVALAYLDRDMNFLRVNKTYADVDGHPPEFYIGKNHFELFPYGNNKEIFYRVRDTGAAHSELAKPFEFAEHPERGVTHWDWTLTPVINLDGDVEALVLALRDVTARVQAIEELQRSERRLGDELAQKEILLREIHHRVKNNLQIVSSLLYLQVNRSPNPEIARLFEASRDRVRAISMVHETLYTADQIGTVNFTTYLDRLTQSLCESYSASSHGIEFKNDVSVDDLSIEAAMPCGLIASELVTNAFKYAFPGGRRGCVEVGLHRAEGDTSQLCLIVRDDGIGIDETILSSPTTLGLKLVQGLVHQLGGELSVGGTSGSQFRITFPNEKGA